MPDIDVTDILEDPFVAGEGFWVYRRAEDVNAHGRSEIVGAWLPAAGSVTPTGDNSLIREEAFQTQAKTIKVITTFRLRGQSRTGAGQNYQPDLVYWEGDFYLVRVLDDFSKFGAGMMEADCSSIDFNDKPAKLPPTPAPGEADFSRAVNSALAGSEE